MKIKNLEELETVKAECKSLILKTAFASGTMGAVPIPGTDILADMISMMKLYNEINKKFGLRKEDIENYDYGIKSAILKAINRIGAKIAGREITKELVRAILINNIAKLAPKTVLKFIPFLGQVITFTLNFNGVRVLGEKHLEECYQIVKSILENKN